MFGKRPPSSETPSDLTLRQVLAVSKPRRFPSFRQWTHAGRVLSSGEKRLVIGAGAVVLCAVFVLLGAFVFAHREEMPAIGGTYTEGVVGVPHFINPLYAPVNDVDADLAHLIYSGLLRWDATNGFVNDLASAVQVSADGKTYTVTVREDAVFQNGAAVSPKDVLFTYEALANPLYRSPLLAAYQGMQLSQPNDQTIVFTLKEPNASVLSLLTVGILPSDLWSDVAPRNAPLAELNLKPIGSGPYAFQEFTKDKKGNVRSYTLARNKNYYGGSPKIEHLTFKFYEDADAAFKALASHNVEGLAYVPPTIESGVEKTHAVHLMRPEIPRVTTLFFNQNRQTLFKNKAVRQAIALSIDRGTMIAQAIGGHGIPVSSPVLTEALAGAAAPTVPLPDLIAANTLLDNAGYPRIAGREFRLAHTPKPAGKKTPAENPSTIPDLSLTLTTVQTTEFLQAAQQVVTQLGALGIKAQIDAVDPQNLLKDTLEPRNYELLLTGLLYGSNPDPYPFWHSSQATSQGLNLADYANKKADELIIKARATLDPKTRGELYAQFAQLLADDVPAIFLYRPTYTYALGNKVKGADIPRVNVPADRFAGIVDWYVKTKQTLK